MEANRKFLIGMMLTLVTLMWLVAFGAFLPLRFLLFMPVATFVLSMIFFKGKPSRIILAIASVVLGAFSIFIGNYWWTESGLKDPGGDALMWTLPVVFLLSVLNGGIERDAGAPH